MDRNQQYPVASASASTTATAIVQPANASTSQTPSASSIPPRLPPSLLTTILTFILPYSGALPPDLLSKPFQQRLIFLPPGEDEMDKQLSPFPLPVGVNALMERLEALAREHALGKEKYGWDGEAYVAKRDLVPEDEMMGMHGQDVHEGQGGLELHFMHEQERGWTFHGLRIPKGNNDAAGSSGSTSGLGTDTPSSASGMVWSDDPSDVSVPLSTSTRSPDADMAVHDALSFAGMGQHAAAGAAQDGHGSEEEDEDGYEAEMKREKEASAFWSAWSPEQNPVELPTPSDGQREEDYWAQYSAGPSVAPSTAQSPALPQRRLSERPEGRVYGAAGAGQAAGSMEERGGGRREGDSALEPEHGHLGGQGQGRTFDSAGGSGMGYPFPATSMSDATGSIPAIQQRDQLAQTSDSAEAAISLNSAPSSPPITAHTDKNPSATISNANNNDARLLRTRLTSKTTSLLRRAWVAYTSGVHRQDELEVRGMRWLEIGRSVCLGPATPTGASPYDTGGAGGGGMNGWYAQSGTIDVGAEQDVRGRMETMYELFDVAYDDEADDDHDGNDYDTRGNEAGGKGRSARRSTREERAGRAFYVLVEQAVRPANGAGPGQADGAERMEVPVGGEMLGRTYSTEQLSFWES